MTDSPYAIRPATAEDLGFIYSSWSAGQHACAPWSNMPDELFRQWHRARMERIMARADTFVCGLPGDDEELLGWLCWEMSAGVLVTHWIYTKAIFRENGVAAALLDAAVPGYVGPVVCSGWSRMAGKWIGKRVELVYDPTVG